MGAIGTDTTHELVSDRFEMAQDYANQTYNVAIQYLQESINQDFSFSWQPGTISTELPVALQGLNIPTVSSLDIMQIVPGTASFNGVLPVMEAFTPAVQAVPEFNVQLPNFFIPSPPTTSVPVFSYSPPSEETIIIPADDIPAFPVAPTITQVQVPDAPVFNVPDFTATMPTADLTPPAMSYIWNEAQYNSGVFDALRTRLIDGIINGGVGMIPEVEQAIYDRAKNRMEIDLQAQEIKAYNEFASRGARMPQGALAARLMETQLQNTLAREDLSRDIIIKSADLAYQYSTFVIEKGIAFEHESMTLFNNIQQRAFEASKFVVEFAIREYEVRVKAFEAMLEAYKVEAEVFKARIQAESAKADLFRAIVDSRKITMEMQALMVDIYGKQVAAVETMARIYAVKMDGAKTHAQIEATRIDRFRALVEAYKAQVEGVTAEYGLYSAKLAGESEKAKFYSHQVDGYKSMVDAYKARSEVDLNTMRAVVEKNKALVDIYTAEIEKYKADIQAVIAQAENQAKIEGLKVQVHDGEVKQFTAVAAAITDAYKAGTSVEVANAEVQAKYGDILARLETAKSELEAEIVKSKAMIASQLCSAALTSVSAGAHLGFSDSFSNSTSSVSSISQNSSDSKSYSENHNYYHGA